MHRMDDWKKRLYAELARAESARLRNNEGQARVCARRAAAIAIREYTSRHGRPASNSSVMDLFEELSLDTGLPPAVRTIIDHLSLHVDRAFQLPEGIDLVAEVRSLCDALLPDWNNQN